MSKNMKLGIKVLIGLVVVIGLVVMGMNYKPESPKQDTQKTNEPLAKADKKETTDKEDDSLSKLQEAKKIKIGITGGFAPSNYHEEGKGDLIGYEVEATKEIIKDLPGDIEIEWVEMSFKSLVASLESDRIDGIFHSMGITPDRAEAYNFTVPYFRSTYGILVHDDSGITKIEELNGKKAGQSINTSTGETAESLGATIVPIDTVKEAVDLVVQKRADFYLADKTGTLYFLEQQPDLPVHLLDEELPLPNDIGAVFPKGADALTEAVNKSIKENTKDGTLGDIYKRELGRDISVEEFR